MNLTEINSAIRTYNRAVGAVSYGNSPHNIARIVELLRHPKDILELGSLAAKMAKADLEEAKTELESLGIEIDKEDYTKDL